MRSFLRDIMQVMRCPASSYLDTQTGFNYSGTDGGQGVYCSTVVRPSCNKFIREEQIDLQMELRRDEGSALYSNILDYFLTTLSPGQELSLLFCD